MCHVSACRGMGSRWQRRPDGMRGTHHHHHAVPMQALTSTLKALQTHLWPRSSSRECLQGLRQRGTQVRGAMKMTQDGRQRLHLPSQLPWHRRMSLLLQRSPCLLLRRLPQSHRQNPPHDMPVQRMPAQHRKQACTSAATCMQRRVLAPRACPQVAQSLQRSARLSRKSSKGLCGVCPSRARRTPQPQALQTMWHHQLPAVRKMLCRSHHRRPWRMWRCQRSRQAAQLPAQARMQQQTMMQRCACHQRLVGREIKACSHLQLVLHHQAQHSRVRLQLHRQLHMSKQCPMLAKQQVLRMPKTHLRMALVSSQQRQTQRVRQLVAHWQLKSRWRLHMHQIACLPTHRLSVNRRLRQRNRTQLSKYLMLLHHSLSLT